MQPPPASNNLGLTIDQAHQVFLDHIKAEGNQWEGEPDPARQTQEDDVGGGKPNAQVEGDEAPQPEGEKPAEESKTEDVIELDPDVEMFDVELEIDGKKEAKKLSLSELQKGYLRQQDYTKKTQEVAEMRRTAQQEIESQAQQARQQYQQQLLVMRQALISHAAPELQNVNWNQLAEQDPAEFVRLSNKQAQLQGNLQRIDAEMQNHAKQLHEQQQAALAQAVQESVKVLQKDIEGWGDEKYKSLLKGGTDEYGFAAEELAQVYDSRVVKMLNDALQWRQLQKAKPQTEKRLLTVPKVVKPGTANQQQTPADNKEQEAATRLRKSGKPEDFAAMLLARGSTKS